MKINSKDTVVECDGMRHMKQLVSVVVPVYNVEQFLARCIDSILAQSYQYFELIIVDDGSPDCCPELCDAYAKINPNIKVVHKENGGLASARNAGLKIATGKYVLFVDSDDWITPKMLEDQVTIAEEKKVDFIRTRPVYANWPNHMDGEVCCFGTEVGMFEGLYTSERIRNEVLPRAIATSRLTMGPIVSAWGGLYNLEFLNRHQLRFDESIRYSEDLIFNVRVLLKANSFYYLESKNYYNYYCNTNSITKKFHGDIWENNKEVIQRFNDDFKNCETIDFTRQLQLIQIFYILNALSKRSAIEEYKMRTVFCRTVCNDPMTVQAFKHIDGLEISWKLWIILLLVRFRCAGILALI